MNSDDEFLESAFRASVAPQKTKKEKVIQEFVKEKKIRNVDPAVEWMDDFLVNPRHNDMDPKPKKKYISEQLDRRKEQKQKVVKEPKETGDNDAWGLEEESAPGKKKEKVRSKKGSKGSKKGSEPMEDNEGPSAKWWRGITIEPKENDEEDKKIVKKIQQSKIKAEALKPKTKAIKEKEKLPKEQNKSELKKNVKVINYTRADFEKVQDRRKERDKEQERDQRMAKLFESIKLEEEKAKEKRKKEKKNKESLNSGRNTSSSSNNNDPWLFEDEEPTPKKEKKKQKEEEFDEEDNVEAEEEEEEEHYPSESDSNEEPPKKVEKNTKEIKEKPKEKEKEKKN